MRRVFLLAFAAFFALSATWAMTVPLGTTADESAHMTWAAAVDDGQLTPPRYDKLWGHDVLWVTARVRGPEVIALLGSESGCSAKDPQKPTTCFTPSAEADSTRLVPTTTIMSLYNPLYYALVGWPVYLLPGLDGLYAMRLISALLCSLLVACAAVVALRVGRIAFAGVLVAATPMVLCQAGSVNPNGPEAAGGLLAFAALSALALKPDPELVRSRLGYLALGAGVIAIVRPAGLEWLVVIAVMAVLMLGARHAYRLVRDRRSWPALGGLAVAILFAAAWQLTRGGLNSIPLPQGDDYTLQNSLSDSVRGTPGMLRSMIGPFSATDTFDPFATEAAWLFLFGFLVLAAALFATRRQLLVVGVWFAGIVFMPIVANALTGPGLIDLWQGRYGLWFAVGLPVYAAMLLDLRLAAWAPVVERRLTWLMVSLVAVGHLAVYWFEARRFGVGQAGSVLPFHFKWSPPMGWATYGLVYVVALALFGFLAWRGTPSSREGSLPPEDLHVEPPSHVAATLP